MGVWGLFCWFSFFSVFCFFVNCLANTLQLMAFSSGTMTRAEKSFCCFLLSRILSPSLHYTRQQNDIVHSCNLKGFHVLCSFDLILFMSLKYERDFNSSWLLIFKKSIRLLIFWSLLIINFWCTRSTESFLFLSHWTWNAIIVFCNYSIA